MAHKLPGFCVLLVLSLMLSTRGIPAAQSPPPHIPPLGITVPETERKELTTAVEALGREIAELKSQFHSDPQQLSLLPDIEIFHKALDWALCYDEFFEPKQIAFANTLLRQGRDRVEQLRSHRAPWLSATGLVVRGYQSKLDGSVQPYGLVVPPSIKPHVSKSCPLYVWLAGRGEKRTELAFLSERESSPGPFTPADTIVLHPYGRFCNANKFACEVNVFESMD